MSADDNAVQAADTLWTTVADATTWADLLRLFSELPADERTDLATRSSLEVKDRLKKLLRPYQTQVSREAILRPFG